MDKLFEIRAAEGGDDSKLFVQDLAKSYVKMFSRLG
jgi:protein subunit release factor A